MGYVAIKGGENAIESAIQLLDFLRTQNNDQSPLSLETIQHQLHFLHSRVLSEGGLYHPELAALAIKQSAGDTLEAAFYLRAYRSTCPRLGETPCHNGQNMRLIRRISAAFKDIPGGQMLGPTTDYLQRLFRFELLDESPEQFRNIARKWLKNMPEEILPTTFPKVLTSLREEGLLPPLTQQHNPPFDITRQPLIFPVPRSANLATMARGETGSLLAIAYSNMRGYGNIHPTVAELRVGYLPIQLPHPITGELTEVGEVLMTECEVVAMYDAKNKDTKPTFTLGYGACFGHNEVKAIAMAILDRALQKGCEKGADNPSEDPEFVLLHVDGIESMGFASHYKMPHYVTFQSDLDRLRNTQKQQKNKND
ncbi:MAG: carbon-phosphorus lyase complex subunit PhnI [Cyanobacteria bacterium P01_G01_bin.49]